MERFDVAVVGAGAAGQFCAALVGQRGLSVVLVDHAVKLGEKIRISGGGRCNFTNLDADDERRFLSSDPRFARHALRAYRPRDFLALLRAHRVGFHEKHRGQLFCDQGSDAIIAMLAAECAAGGVRLRHPVRGLVIRPPSEAGRRWTVEGAGLQAEVGAVVVATGGLSVPAIGASDFAWTFARNLGLATIAPRPGLVALTCDEAWRSRFGDLSGLALPVVIGLAPRGSAPRFEEDLLFTHRGLSGPAALQISSYRDAGQALSIDLAPGADLAGRLQAEATTTTIGRIVGDLLPRRLAAAMLGDDPPTVRPVELSRSRQATLVDRIRRFTVTPTGTEGMRKAEVTCGGVATAELERGTMAVRRWPGLYLIGEGVDVTGWLGGYNFQWAWASAAAAALAIAGRIQPQRAGR
ncbi:MAG: aminoacetone oxidase family FAD-binding enzyme [Burkholderiaceae bacterium]